MTMFRTYRELSKLETFDERFDYLKLSGCVGAETFGSSRYLNQEFYASDEWRSIRDRVILRDEGCDLGVPGRIIHGRILVHHMNPVTEDELVHGSRFLVDLDNLVCTSFITHQAIHYGDKSLLFPEPIERYPNDTCPWKGGRL